MGWLHLVKLFSAPETDLWPQCGCLHSIPMYHECSGFPTSSWSAGFYGCLSWAASPAVHTQCGVAIGAIFRCGYNSGNRLPEIMYTVHAIMCTAVRPRWRSYKAQSAAAKATRGQAWEKLACRLDNLSTENSLVRSVFTTVKSLWNISLKQNLGYGEGLENLLWGRSRRKESKQK